LSIYNHLTENMRHGSHVHVDETKVTTIGSAGQGQTGYVWAFTNLKDVVYTYSASREGVTLKSVLGDFHGVLVSDFYAAYDSVDCPHQKCLIHLVRDMNADLFRNPLDTEMVRIGQEFTSLLKGIVEGIDRHGLRKTRLKRYKHEAVRFLDGVEAMGLTSDVAIGYQKRFKKNRDSLFTFLDYDGVPWNNNRAEHAIKQFVHLQEGFAHPPRPRASRHTWSCSASLKH